LLQRAGTLLRRNSRQQPPPASDADAGDGASSGVDSLRRRSSTPITSAAVDNELYFIALCMASGNIGLARSSHVVLAKKPKQK
jgi:hypothetical protein